MMPTPAVGVATSTLMPGGKLSPNCGFQTGVNQLPSGPVFFAVRITVLAPGAGGSAPLVPSVTVNGRSTQRLSTAASAVATCSAVEPTITPTENTSSRMATERTPLSVAGPEMVMVCTAA